jgi:hypothetical protein
MHLQQVDRAAAEAIRSAAAEIFSLLMRVHGAEPSTDAPARTAYLIELMNGELQILNEKLISVRNERLRPITSQLKAEAPVSEAAKAAQTVIAQYSAEVQIAVAGLVNTGKLASTVANSVHVSGNLGVVQFGKHAVSNVGELHQPSTDIAGLASVFEQLVAAIKAAPHLDEPARADIAEVVDELKAEARKSKPNRSKVTGLISGVSTAIQTIPNVAPAWAQIVAWSEALRAAL